MSLPWQKEVAKGSYDRIFSNVHLVHVLKFCLRHLPFDLSSVYTQLPQIIYIYRICQLNLCTAASISARRVTCPIHCILLDFITLSDEKHKLCRSPFYMCVCMCVCVCVYIYIYIYIDIYTHIYTYMYIYIYMDFINHIRRICGNGKAYNKSETFYFYPEGA